MPTLANYRGGSELRNSGSSCKTQLELGRSCSISSTMDVYYPPNKRARFNSQFLSDQSEIDQNQQPSIDVLPDECLFEILRRLPGARERISSCCVSKRWIKILTTIRKSEFASDLVGMVPNDNDDICLEGKKASDLRLASMAVVGMGCNGSLNKLSIRGSNSVGDFGVSAVARANPSLKALAFWNVPFVGDKGLSEIARECPSLEKLDLLQCSSISNKGLIEIAKNCPNLTALTLESCSKIGNEALQALGKCCKRLESISIKDCPLIGDNGVSSLVSSSSFVLTKVKLQGLNITDFSLAVIGHYGKAITNLALGNLANVTERGFWAMGNAAGLEKLTTLGITSCLGLTDLSLAAIGSGCRTLNQISLKRCVFVSDHGLTAFSKASGSLESLQLEECNGVTQAGVINLLANCATKLKCLSLINCTGIRDLALNAADVASPCISLRSLSVRNSPGFGSFDLSVIGKLCPNLHQLDLSGLYGITDSAIIPLIENNKAGLVKVNLSGCFNLSDAVVLALARFHGETIKVLNLECCRRITDASLVAIAENCVFLSDLDVSKCSVTDYGVAALSRTEKKLNLQILSLSNCSNVSGKSVQSLKRLGKTLIGLNLQKCKISSKTVELLKESLWQCDILS